jgi:hypothetical protein
VNDRGNGKKFSASELLGGPRVFGVVRHTDGTRHVGPVAAMETIIPGPLPEELPGCVALHLLCFKPGGDETKHAALLCVGRRWPKFAERLRGATHQITFSMLSRDFDHSVFTSAGIVGSLADIRFMSQLTLRSDREAREICRELAVDVADGSLPDRCDGEAAGAWAEMLEFYTRKATGAESVEVRWDGK